MFSFEKGSTAVQVTPPGFVMHTIPYADESRDVAIEPKVLSEIAAPVTADSAAVKAAGDLIDAMTDTSVTRYAFSNTETDFSTLVLRAQIMGSELPAPQAHKDSMSHYLEQLALSRRMPATVRDAYLNRVRTRRFFQI